MRFRTASIRRSARRTSNSPSLFDQQLADEMQHVRFANVWIKKIVDREGARAMMALARAIAHANAAMKEIVGDDVVFYPVSDDLRREAGFSDDEIQTARRTRRPEMTGAAGALESLSAAEIDAVGDALEARAAPVRDVVQRNEHAAGDRAGAAGDCHLRN